MDDTNLSIMSILYLEKQLNIGKAALALAMVDDELDDLLVSLLETKGMKAVITRAGGRGDNLINKLLRNSVQAAKNQRIIPDSAAGCQAVCTCVEKAISSFNSGTIPVSGAGVKIGIVTFGGDIALAFFGTIGISGIDADSQISGLGTLKGVIH